MVCQLVLQPCLPWGVHQNVQHAGCCGGDHLKPTKSLHPPDTGGKPPGEVEGTRVEHQQADSIRAPVAPTPPGSSPGQCVSARPLGLCIGLGQINTLFSCAQQLKANLWSVYLHEVNKSSRPITLKLAEVLQSVVTCAACVHGRHMCLPG